MARIERRRLISNLFALQSPSRFRDRLLLSSSPSRLLRDEIQPWQSADFEALDPAWCRLAGMPCDDEIPHRRAYIERPRGHSKTSDMAAQIAWILLAARTAIVGVAAAADREQAALLLAAIKRLASLNPTLCHDLTFVEGAVRNRRTGSRLDLISSDVGSSYGILPDFVICDELSHWPGPELWYSLLSSAAKKPDCVLAVLTNAGVGRGWQWEVREQASQSPHWYFSSLDGPHAPWITEQSLDEQQALLPPAVYERLWLNRWQHSDGEFVSLAEAEVCLDPTLTRKDHGSPQHQYIAAIDYAEKHDYTVGVIVHREGDRTIVDRMDVVRPSPQHPTPIAWVEAWIEHTAMAFPEITFVLDEYQLVATLQKYETRYVMRRFPFLGGLGNHRLALHLRQSILQRNLAWYPGCGTYPATATSLWQETPPTTGETLRDDLVTELSSLLLRQNSSGRVRIDHRADAHDDRSFALGAACLQLVGQPPAETQFLDITPPADRGGFDWY
ncbi:MAG: terminase [Planctomycetota bacterium]|nr:MAG: terminase [Planctomycetota bacterium]